MTPVIAKLWQIGSAELGLIKARGTAWLRLQRTPLAVGCVLSGAYVVAGGLSWTAALLGLLALAAWTWWRPGASETAAGTVQTLALAGDSASTTPADSLARSAEPTWRAMLAGLPDAALVLDSKAVVLAANARAQEQVSAVSARHLSQTSRSPELLAAVDRALATAEPQSCQTRMQVPVERLVMGLVMPIGPVTGPHSQPALLVILRDLTEQDQLARMRADFVANASHELRTPLTSLKGFIETMQGPARNDPEARERFLQIMLEQAGRMSRLIEDLLSLSRIEMHEHIAPRAVLDLSELTLSAMRDLEPAARQAGVTIVAASSPKADASAAVAAARFNVIGDRDELLQVALNLIQNAIKYNVRGGRVEIGLKEEGNRIAFSVTDTGIGIAPEHLPRLTERFYRVSAKASRERGGTGLGLAIVKHIINHHRGEFRVASRPAEGSVFTVLLPRAGA